MSLRAPNEQHMVVLWGLQLQTGRLVLRAWAPPRKAVPVAMGLFPLGYSLAPLGRGNTFRRDAEVSRGHGLCRSPCCRQARVGAARAFLGAVHTL
jgi:hypothetical protein